MSATVAYNHQQQQQQPHTITATTPATITDTDLDLSKLNWKNITRNDFGNRITPEHVQTHYAIIIRKSHKWTEAQVERLSEGVAAHTSAIEGLTSESWERIASEFGKAVRSSSVDGYKDKAVLTSTLSLVDKYVEDCRVDFKHLISVSIPMMSELEKEVGDLTLNFSHQPRKHWAWTAEQLIAMKSAVREITGGFMTLSQAIRIMTVSDWERVAKKVEPLLTRNQGRYRWRRVEKQLPSLLTPDLKEPIPYSDHDTIYAGQRRQARLWTAEEKLMVHRTNIEIRRKTNEILGRSLGPLSKATGTSGYDAGSDSPAKAALSIVKVNRDTIAARRHSGILTGIRFRAETLPANMVGDDREQQQTQIRPPISATTETEAKIPTRRLVWDREDISKLTELVQKYVELTLGCKQISGELSHPVSKC
ncbi:hypothetical protein K457DRAFT_21592 [Linnemannia elongata AG-77]|uniref:Uncharacterized protein n=1 Tax=Linnemannia elongata AG-77 TaxID=1314771 RepID=A0A197JNX7_9FUNG|nr:hypothetical protein K457DRAFT_21592 [Linnemannia elongata AG-77]